jgi:hypothetical protein
MKRKFLPTSSRENYFSVEEFRLSNDNPFSK